jgi:hypothetical protein
VAGELERRWNEALQAVHRIEGEIAAIVAGKPLPLGERERQQLMQLGADLELAWSHPAATAATRKRILRTALNEMDISRRRDRLAVKSESNRCPRLRVVVGSVRNEAYTGVHAEKLEVSRRHDR